MRDVILVQADRITETVVKACNAFIEHGQEGKDLFEWSDPATQGLVKFEESEYLTTTLGLLNTILESLGADHIIVHYADRHPVEASACPKKGCCENSKQKPLTAP